MKSSRWFKLLWLVAVIMACASLLLPSAAPDKVCAWGCTDKKLTVVSAPEHGGNITYDPPLNAAGTYSNGVEVTLTAVPSTGCEFEQWSGDIGDNEANSSTISVVMDRARTIIADFTGCEGPYDITVAAGTCLSDPTRINVSFGSFTCRAYPTSTGTMVDITAVAAEGYRFDGWKGSITGSQGNMSFVSNSSETITAEFSKASESPQSLWIWMVIGIAVLLMVGLLIYKVKIGRANKAEDYQPHSDVEQPKVS